MVRMDSAYYAARVITAIRRVGAHFSVTARMDAKVDAAIAAIPEDAWTAIQYPRRSGTTSCALGLRRRSRRGGIHGVHLEERAGGHRPADRPPGPRPEQAGRRGPGRAVPLWRYHAVFTDSPFELLQAEGSTGPRDRGAGLRRLSPTGRWRTCRRLVPRQRAWLACAAIACNLLRAAGSLPASPTPGPAAPRCAAT